MADDNEHLDESGNLNQNHENDYASRRNDESRSEMLRPWMRTLGKKYYQNEYLGKFETLDDAVDAMLRRPEPKTVPESYGESEAVENAYRAAELTKKEAEAISAAFRTLMPPEKEDLQKHFGDRYEAAMKDYSKGVGSFAEDLKDSIAKAGLDKDPVFVDVMARVGKETGVDHFNSRRGSAGTKKDPALRAIEAIYGTGKE